MLNMRWILLVVVLGVPCFSWAQAPTCEEQLALSNQLVQDLHADRGRLQVEAASLKVQTTLLRKAITDEKAEQEKKATKEKKS